MSGEFLDHALFIAVGVVLACVAVLCLAMLPAQHRLAITAIAAVPQFVVPGMFESATIFQAWVAASALITAARDHPRFPSLQSKLLVALAATYLIATLWSALPGIAPRADHLRPHRGHFCR